MFELQASQTHLVFHHTEDLFISFIIHSDRNCSSLGICCCTPEVLHTILDLLPHCCVTRPHSVLFSSNDMQMLQKAQLCTPSHLSQVSGMFPLLFLSKLCHTAVLTFFTGLNDQMAGWLEGATEQKAVWKSCFKKKEFQLRFESRQTSGVVHMYWEFQAWLLQKNLWAKNFGLIRTQVHATETQKSK